MHLCTVVDFFLFGILEFIVNLEGGGGGGGKLSANKLFSLLFPLNRSNFCVRLSESTELQSTTDQF